ncbi:MAG: hypothetical protein GY941_12295 [Planctomycetes bacterium]|nr:hypothetical protein [Planctomycetota bacterium]
MAEESLTVINDGAVAGGNLKKEESHKYIKSLSKQASARDEKKRSPQVNRDVLLASMGIPVIDMRTRKTKGQGGDACEEKVKHKLDISKGEVVDSTSN